MPARACGQAERLPHGSVCLCRPADVFGSTDWSPSWQVQPAQAAARWAQVLTVAAEPQRLADGGRARVKDEAAESQADAGGPKQEAPPNGPEAAAA